MIVLFLKVYLRSLALGCNDGRVEQPARTGTG